MKTDERLHLETSALENSLRNGDQLTLSSQLIKPNFLVNPAPTNPASQFLKELARFILKSKQTNIHITPPPHTHTHTQTNDHKTGQKPFGP